TVYVLDKNGDIIRPVKDMPAGEIPFVVTMDNQLIASIRSNNITLKDGKYVTGNAYWDSIPHPSLSKGQKVKTAGTLTPRLEDGEWILEIENASGHLWPTYDSLFMLEDMFKFRLKELQFKKIKLKDTMTGEIKEITL
ncbi:MAG: hypothetical protein ACOC1K_07745, partial [Nanoarchaeota archaeon]